MTYQVVIARQRRRYALGIQSLAVANSGEFHPIRKDLCKSVRSNTSIWHALSLPGFLQNGEGTYDMGPIRSGSLVRAMGQNRKREEV